MATQQGRHCRNLWSEGKGILKSAGIKRDSFMSICKNAYTSGDQWGSWNRAIEEVEDIMKGGDDDLPPPPAISKTAIYFAIGGLVFIVLLIFFLRIRKKK